ncbi:ABC transmembrane type-1 domain-containing protein [Aphelenchoides besseyi]|nr:ABC transmembrane type-1 domain-containing protein [Aphelenchoides besseyi]
MGVKSQKTDNVKIESASLYQMMRYATRWDWLTLIVGTTSIMLVSLQKMGSLLIYGRVAEILIEAEGQYQRNALDMRWFQSEIVPTVSLYFVQCALSLALYFTASACFLTLCERQIHRIRQRLFARILNQDIPWLERNQIGTLTQKMSSGIDRIRDGMSDKLQIILEGLSALFISLIFAFVLRQSLRGALKKELDAYGKAGAVAEEVIHAIRTVLAFNAQMFETQRYANLLNDGCRSGIRKAFFVSLFSGIFQFAMFAKMGVVFWYGTNLVVNGTVSPATVFSGFLMIMDGKLVSSTKQLRAIKLGMAIPQFRAVLNAQFAAAEIFEVIDRVRSEATM